MRELILLRHAHADGPTTGQDDLLRPLSAVGLSEAQAAGDWLREHALQPDRVLCSNAARTRQTLDALGELGCTDVREEAAIYEASPGTLIALADAHRDARRLLLIGHNPGLEDLLLLATEGDMSTLRGEAETKYPTATFATIELPIAGWAGAEERIAGRLTAFVRPRDLDASLGPDE